MSHDRGPLKLSVGRTIPLVFGRSVVDGVVRTAGEFEDVIGDLDGEAVVQVSRKHEDSFIQSVPVFYKFLLSLNTVHASSFLMVACLSFPPPLPRVEP